MEILKYFFVIHHPRVPKHWVKMFFLAPVSHTGMVSSVHEFSMMVSAHSCP